MLVANITAANPYMIGFQPAVTIEPYYKKGAFDIFFI